MYNYAMQNKPAKLFHPLSLVMVPVCLLFFCAAFWITTHADRSIVEDNDFFNFWLGARMTWKGQDALNSTAWISESHLNGSVWIPEKIYNYPLPLAILMSPLGALPLRLAYLTWIFMTMVGVTCATLLLMSLWKLPTAHVYILPLILGILVNRSFFTTVRNGQMGGMFLLFLALAVFFWERENWFVGGLLISVLMLKPSFGFPIIGLCGIWLLARRQWSAIGGIALAGLLMVGMGCFVRLDWPLLFLNAATTVAQRGVGYSPTLWGAAHLVCADTGCGQALGLGLAVVLSLGCGILLILRRDALRPQIALSLIVCTAVLVTPYLWAYDHILLFLPFLVLAGQMAKLKWPFLLTATSMLLVSLLGLILLMIASARASDEWSVLLPVVCLGLLCILFRQDLFGAFGTQKKKTEGIMV